MENHAPVADSSIIELTSSVGEVTTFAVKCIEPDCFIFSRSKDPTTNHIPEIPVSGNFRTDMDDLHGERQIKGFIWSSEGVWLEPPREEAFIIWPTGLIKWAPKFEGMYKETIHIHDNWDTAIVELTIIARDEGRTVNHPPVILEQPTQPVVIKAGEEFLLHYPNIIVSDPDGDQLYASCNIGYCGRAPDGSFIWKFQSSFPGVHDVKIIFRDIRDGYTVMEFSVEVKAWYFY